MRVPRLSITEQVVGNTSSAALLPAGIRPLHNCPSGSPPPGVCVRSCGRFHTEDTNCENPSTRGPCGSPPDRRPAAPHSTACAALVQGPVSLNPVAASQGPVREHYQSLCSCAGVNGGRVRCARHTTRQSVIRSFCMFGKTWPGTRLRWRPLRQSPATVRRASAPFAPPPLTADACMHLMPSAPEIGRAACQSRFARAPIAPIVGMQDLSC